MIIRIAIILINSLLGILTVYSVQGQDLFTNKSGKINFVFYSSDHNRTGYPLRIRNDSIHIDTLSAIAELLTFQGDTSYIPFAIKSYGPVSYSYNLEDPRDSIYSSQVDALYLINQFFLEEPFEYAGVPVLYDRCEDTVQKIKGEVIEKAYSCYREWFEKIKKYGIDELRQMKFYPLDNCKCVEWYGMYPYKYHSKPRHKLE